MDAFIPMLKRWVRKNLLPVRLHPHLTGLFFQAFYRCIILGGISPIKCKEFLVENSNSISANVPKTLEKDVLFTVTDIARLLNLSRDNDIIPFLEIKKYIVRQTPDRDRKGNLIATILGVQSGWLVNQYNRKHKRIQFYITEKGMEKIEKAFCHPELTPEQQRRVNAICAEYEKKMRPSALGRAE